MALFMQQVARFLKSKPYNTMPVWSWILLLALVLGGSAVGVYVAVRSARQDDAVNQSDTLTYASTDLTVASSLVLSLVNAATGTPVYSTVVPNQSVFELVSYATLADLNVSDHIYSRLSALDIQRLYKLSENAVFVLYNTLDSNQPLKFGLIAGRSDTTTIFTSSDNVLSSLDLAVYNTNANTWTSTFGTSTYAGYAVVVG